MCVVEDIVIDTSPNETVLSLKRKISDITHIPVGQLHVEIVLTYDTTPHYSQMQHPSSPPEEVWTTLVHSLLAHNNFTHLPPQN